jgi:hypothetical protein
MDELIRKMIIDVLNKELKVEVITTTETNSGDTDLKTLVRIRLGDDYIDEDFDVTTIG